MKRTLAEFCWSARPPRRSLRRASRTWSSSPTPPSGRLKSPSRSTATSSTWVVYIKLVLSCFPQGGWQTTPPWPPRVRGWRAPCQGSGGGGTWCGAAFDQAREGRRPGRDARLSRPAGFRALDESVHRNGDGTGPFSFGISCTTCGNGALGITSNVVFSIANATIADITAGNPLNIFVADVSPAKRGTPAGRRDGGGGGPRAWHATSARLWARQHRGVEPASDARTCLERHRTLLQSRPGAGQGGLPGPRRFSVGMHIRSIGTVVWFHDPRDYRRYRSLLLALIHCLRSRPGPTRA